MRTSKPVPAWPQDTDAFVRWCLGCKANRHKECDKHINDGAVDALEFIDVRCDCPCEGEVRGKLIDLVAQLRQEAATAAAAIEELGSALDWRSRQYRTLDAAIVRFLERSTDDEGDFNPLLSSLEELRGTWELARTQAKPEPQEKEGGTFD